MSLLYFVVFLLIFLLIYVLVNLLTISIFNKNKNDFSLKNKSKYRLANNYVYGNDSLGITQNGDLNCSSDVTGNNENDMSLLECDIDEYNEMGVGAKCAQCKQISARCVNIPLPVYSPTDQNLVIIQPNISPKKGYCLPAETIKSSCTRRNGGKWILTTNSLPGSSEDDADIDKHLVYTFECFCSTPNFFQSDYNLDNDCTRFVGCRNGTLEDGWKSFEDMKCTCPENLYEELKGNANQPPSCVLLNVYRRDYNSDIPQPPFNILDKLYVEPDYLSLLQSNRLSLPDPCTFDVTTKTFIKDIGRVVLNKTGNIAYCESLHSNYRTTVINDDYLRGNGGKYANAMFRFRINDNSEKNNDADDNYNDYENGIMYEVYRKGAQIENIAGIRLPYYNFTVYLPFLETTSYNMGDASGRNYELYPIVPIQRQTFTMVYVFDVSHPDYELEIVFGNGISYIPSFMSTSSESGYRVYNGAIPCVNVGYILTWQNKRAFWIMYPLPPARDYKNKLGTKGIMGDDELFRPDVESDKFTSGYGFNFAYDGRVEPYTELFTGTLFTYTIANRIYTRPVSCGLKVLTSKYRRNYDPMWRSVPPEPIVGVASSSPLEFAKTGRDSHMFTRNSYDVERNEIGVTTQFISRYEFSFTGVEFLTFYS